MSNYTTQTSALKATTIDTKFLDAKRIDTLKLYINGKVVDSSSVGGIKTWNGRFGDNECSLYGGALLISLWGPLEIYAEDWMPHKLFINDKEVICETKEGAGAWEFYIAEPNDDFAQLYGGITDNTSVKMYYSLR